MLATLSTHQWIVGLHVEEVLQQTTDTNLSLQTARVSIALFAPSAELGHQALPRFTCGVCRKATLRLGTQRLPPGWPSLPGLPLLSVRRS